MSDPILRRMALMVEAQATDLSITLWLPGTTISGLLTSRHFFVQWCQEAFRRTALGGGHFKVPGPTVPGPTDEERLKVKAESENRLGARDIEANFAGDDETGVTLILRNARTLQGTSNAAFPYLLVDPAHVQAWAIGDFGPPR